MPSALITAPLAAIVAVLGVVTIIHQQDLWLAGSMLAAAALLLAMPVLDRWQRQDESEAESE